MAIAELKDFERENRRRARKKWLADKANKVADFVKYNKEVIILVAAGVPVLVNGVIKPLIKKSNLKKEQDIKDLYCYDRSLGHYWKLNRELTNNEWLEINRKKADGESLGNILQDMRVLR